MNLQARTTGTIHATISAGRPLCPARIPAVKAAGKRLDFATGADVGLAQVAVEPVRVGTRPGSPMSCTRSAWLQGSLAWAAGTVTGYRGATC